MVGKKIFKYFLLFISLLAISLSYASFVLSGSVTIEDIEPVRGVSGLTNYVTSSSNSGTIFDNPATSDAYAGYDISEDCTFDSTNKIVELGIPNSSSGITIANNFYFAHANNSLTYSITEYTDKSFMASTGGTDAVNGSYGNRLYTIKLVSDVTISGTLSIGALVGRTGTGASGGVINGAFVVLDLNGHTLTVNSGATLNAWGYIIDTKLDANSKHMGSIQNYGTIVAGFVVEDYHGGTLTVGRGFGDCMPFALYSIPYLSCKVVNHTLSSSSSNIILGTTLYAQDAFHTTRINWFGNGSNYFLQATYSGVNRECLYTMDTYNNLYTGKEIHYKGNSTLKPYSTHHDFNGDFKTNNLSLTITLGVSATIPMLQFDFHIPSYVNLSLSGTGSKFNLNMNLELMPGATLKTEAGTTLTLSSSSYTFKVGEYEPRKGTSFGGIVVATEMPPTSTYNYFNTSDSTNLLYNFNPNHFSNYLIEQKQNFDYLYSGDISNYEAKVSILGNIAVDSSSADNSHVLAGAIELSNSAYSYIVNNLNRFNLFYKDAQTFEACSSSALLTWVGTYWLTSDSNPAQFWYCGYTIKPLVVTNRSVTGVDGVNYYGQIINNNSEFSSVFGTNVIFDLRSGVYKNLANNKLYVFMLDNGTGTGSQENPNSISVNGSFVEIESINDDHSITYNKTKYVYYEDTFVNTSIAHSSASNINGAYVINTNAAGQQTYNQISNYQVTYTYESDLVIQTYKYNSSVTDRMYQYHRQRYERISWKDVETGNRYWQNVPTINTNSTNQYVSNTETINGSLHDGLADVSNINLSSSNMSTSQPTDLRNFALSATYGNTSYMNIGTCTLSVYRSISETPDYQDSERSFNDSDKYETSWTETGKEGVYRYREKYVYLDYVDLSRTETFETANFIQEDVPVYLQSTSMTSSYGLKYNTNTGYWTK